MKKLVLSLTVLFIVCCSSDNSSGSDSNSCMYNGHILHKGPKGGCYYIDSSGNEEYVDKSYCNCSH